MELKKYIYPLRRWWWLLAAATLVAAFSSFLVTLQQPPVYQALTTIMIGRAIEDPNPSANEFWLGQQLAGTYADIANREAVRVATMKALGLNWLPAYRARALSNSQLIEIAVTDTNPERAMVVANELANQLILQSPTGARPDEKSRLEFVTQQLDTLEVQIKQTQEDIDRLQEELGNMISARQITDTQTQIVALQAKLTTLQANYGTLLSNTEGGAINTLSVIEPAGLPTKPVGPAKLVSVLVAAMIGFVLAAGAAYLLEYLDDTLKTPEEISRQVGHPLIGYITEIEAETIEQPFVTEHPRHPIAEAFRTLRTNLEFASVDQALKTVLVTSADTSEGKTFVAANLAASMAQGDKKVCVIDADLRKPRIHEFLGMSNDFGLSDLFRGRLILHGAMRIWKGDGRVAVITGGNPPPNPAELLASKKMDQILTSLEDSADIVIVDGPPFIVADAALVASKVDGVVIVIRPGFTQRAAVEAMMEQINRSGARILGVVLNRIPRKLADYYAGQLHLSAYYYGSPYYPTEEPSTGQVKKWQQAASRYAQAFTNGIKPGSRARNVIGPVETPKQSNE